VRPTRPHNGLAALSHRGATDERGAAATVRIREQGGRLVHGLVPPMGSGRTTSTGLGSLDHASSRGMTGRDWLLVVVTVAPVLALAVVALVQVGHGYLGVSDNGMTELRIADIGTHWPSIGPFSRDGWSHPGPALFYALVLPYRLTGSHSNGMLVGAALINAAALAGMVVLARRGGGTALALLVTLGCTVAVTSLGLDFLWDPWNPYITVLPFGVVVLAAWCVTCGDRWCLPVVAAVGTFCAQTHVAYVPLVAVAGGLAVVGGALTARRGRDASAGSTAGLRAPLLAAGGVLVLLWIPPVVQQLTSSEGNLQAILDYFGGPKTMHSLGDGYRIVTSQFSWNPDWIVGSKGVNPFSGEPHGAVTTSFPVWWLGLAIALVAAWLRESHAVRNLGVVLGVMILASVVAISRTIGALAEYRLRFVWILGMLTAVFVVWVLWLWIERRGWLPARGVALAVAGAAIVVGVANLVVAHDTVPPNAEQGAVAADLSAQLRRNLPRRPGTTLISVKSFEAGPLITGIMTSLERAGATVVLRDGRDDRLRFGNHRMLSNQPIRDELRVVVDDEIEAVQSQPCTREVAYSAETSRRARDEALVRRRRINAALARGDLEPRAALSRIQELSRDLSAAAVFAVRAGPTGTC
jgi:hypothetical protein